MKSHFLNSQNKGIILFLALFFVCLLPGCKYFYKINTLKKVTPTEVTKYNFQNKYLILHQGFSAWHISELAISDNNIKGQLTELPENRVRYQSSKPKRIHRYKKRTEFYVLDEVHLYLNDTLVPKLHQGDTIGIAVSSISKAEVYQKAVGRTTVSWVVPIIAATYLVAVVVAASAAVVVVATTATKTSCPLVYAKSDNSFTFAGEIFGGAVYSSLERHDYMPLPGIKPSKGSYELIISNELPEIQYINLAELVIVNHPKNTSILTDRQGVVHTINQPEEPEEALTTSNSDILSLVNRKDQQCFLFDEEPSVTGDTCAFNTAFLTFQAPDLAKAGKLIIKAGNSLWGDYTYGEFTKLFGCNYGAWIKKQGNEPTEKYSRWKLDQRFALMVYLETKTGWQFVDYFDLIGPLGAREMIMPVDLSQALVTSSTDSEKQIRIKLESGFKFWDLDYVAMDFTTDTPFTIDYVKPSSAKTESGIDVTNCLSQNDSLYYIQEIIGEQGLVVFKDSPEIPGMKKSVFLHTKGYYEHVRNYPNPPDKKQLETFLIPGRFSKFSNDNFNEFRKNNWFFVEEMKLP